MRIAQLLLLVAVLAAVALSQNANGPDIVITDLNAVSTYGHGGSGTTYAYAVGTTTCNSGNAQLAWDAATSHPP